MAIRRWTALSLATAISFGATQAGASLVQATAQSIYTVAAGPRGAFPVEYCFAAHATCSAYGADGLLLNDLSSAASSYANFIFDTDLGVLSHGEFGSETLTWDASMGTPSPLLEGAFQASGTLNFFQDLSDATSFTITRSNVGLQFTISGAGYSFAGGRAQFGAPIDDGVAFSLSSPYAPEFYGFGFYDPTSTVQWGSLLLASQYEQRATLTPLPIPEPSSWGLLVAGFAGIGGAMRRARRLLHRPDAWSRSVGRG